MNSNILKLIVNYILPNRCFSCRSLVDVAGLCATCFGKLNFIAQPFCQKCGTHFEFEIKERMFCGRCISSPPRYDFARALLHFDPESKRIIHNFKYNDQTVSAKIFAQLLVNRYKLEWQQVDIIAPVPMHRFKRIFRRYNPPQLLAEKLGLYLEREVVVELLTKTKWTKPQTYLKKQDREKNLANTIIHNSLYNIEGKYILLVDDVRTTGSTADYCVKILKQAGAAGVMLVTIAMT